MIRDKIRRCLKLANNVKKRGLKWLFCTLFGEKLLKYVLIVNDFIYFYLEAREACQNFLNGLMGGTEDFLDEGGQASMGGPPGVRCRVGEGSPPFPPIFDNPVGWPTERGKSQVLQRKTNWTYPYAALAW